MKKLILAATLAALIPALAMPASAHRPTSAESTHRQTQPDTPGPVKFDPKTFFDKQQRETR